MELSSDIQYSESNNYSSQEQLDLKSGTNGFHKLAKGQSIETLDQDDGSSDERVIFTKIERKRAFNNRKLKAEAPDSGQTGRRKDRIPSSKDLAAGEKSALIDAESNIDKNNKPIKVENPRDDVHAASRPMKRPRVKIESPSPSPPLESASETSNIMWKDLNIPPAELRPDLTLCMGQCFNWKNLNPSYLDGGTSIWAGVVDGIPILIRQQHHTTEYALMDANIESSIHIEVMLRDYFQLSHSLEKLYAIWSNACPRMALICSHLPGVRVVRQDPWECLISFICSSCNNIKRITQMLDTLRRNYGEYLCSVGISKDGRVIISQSQQSSSESSFSIDLFRFPEPSVVANIDEMELRRLGFGKWFE